MQSPMLYHSSPEGYRWNSRRLGLWLHFVVLASICLNLAIVALVILVQKKEFYITDKLVYTLDGGDSPHYWSSLLPALGSIIGSIIAFIASTGIALLVATYAKHQGFNKGLSLKKINHLSLLSAAGVPVAWSPLFIIGLIITVSLNLTSTSIVQALTPTLLAYNSSGAWPIVSFQTVPNLNIRCNYQTSEQGFGYGPNCPVNDKYGIMFDAGIAVLTNDPSVQPNDPSANFTRRGVSYPSALSGLSGGVTTMAADIISSVIGKGAVKNSTDTIAVSCLPRTTVTANCKNNLDGTGLSYNNLGKSAEPGRPYTIQEMQFCDSSGCSNRHEFRQDFGSGTVFIFAENRPSEGSTSLVILATGQYATDLGSPQVYCNVSAQESFIPIRIRGFAAEEVKEGYTCPDMEQSPATAEFLTNVTFMSQMVMQKMQGQDGRLEILGLINSTNGRTKGEMLDAALKKMLEVGATEMYTRLPAEGVNATQPCALETPRTVLGSRTRYGFLWAIPPAVMSLIFFLGWLMYGFRKAAQAYWSPLDPGCMAVAGVAVPKDSTLFHAVNRLAGASVNHINECIQGPLRLGEVDNSHLALTMDSPDVAPGPQRGRSYGAPLPYTPTSTTMAMSPEIKPLFTPMGMTPMSPDPAMAHQSAYYALNNGNNGSYFPHGSTPPPNPTYPAYPAYGP